MKNLTPLWGSYLSAARCRAIAPSCRWCREQRRWVGTHKHTRTHRHGPMNCRITKATCVKSGRVNVSRASDGWCLLRYRCMQRRAQNKGALPHSCPADRSTLSSDRNCCKARSRVLRFSAHELTGSRTDGAQREDGTQPETTTTCLHTNVSYAPDFLVLCVVLLKLVSTAPNSWRLNIRRTCTPRASLGYKYCTLRAVIGLIDRGQASEHLYEVHGRQGSPPFPLAGEVHDQTNV